MTRMPLDPPRSEREDFVVCVVGDQRYALRGSDLRLIARAEQMRGGPGPDGRVGTLHVADQQVPVFALGALLGHPAPPAHRTHAASYIAVTGAVGELVGWLVDRITRPAVSADTLLAPLPPIVGAAALDSFDALLQLGDEAMLLLVPHQLNPLGRRTSRRRLTGVAATRPLLTTPPEPMVVLFSTPALPPCEAPRYALSGRQVAAVVQPAQVVAVPGCAPYVRGVFWWRQSIVTVVDFRQDGTREGASRCRHLIAQSGDALGGSLIAMPVGSDIALHRPVASDQFVPDAEQPEFLHGTFEVRGERVALVSLDALLTTAG